MIQNSITALAGLAIILVVASDIFRSLLVPRANPAPALIARLDDYRFVRVNEGFLELSGWSRDDIIGHSIYDIDILGGAKGKLDLIAAIEGAMQDSTWLSQKIMDRLAALRGPSTPSKDTAPLVELTQREREVLGLITKGKSDDAIAEALSLKRNTVRNHVARLYSKIGAHNRGEAIIWARDRGHHLGPHGN